MKTMIYFEWKKIFERKMNIVAMLAGLAVVLVCVYMFVQEFGMYDKYTNTYPKGIEGMEFAEKTINGMTDYITEEYVTDTIRYIQSFDLDVESDEAWEAYIRNLSDMYYFIAKDYEPIGVASERYNKLNNKELGLKADFYKTRIDKIEEYLNKDYSFGNFSDKEKEYWMNKAQALETPLKWGYTDPITMVWNIITAGSFYLLFIVCICTAPCFASEYESGAVALLLTTKYGKTKQVFAKIAASVIFAVMYVTTTIGIGVILIGAIGKFSGAELPIQLSNPHIPYILNHGQVCLISAALAILVAMTYTGITLVLSSRISSSLAIFAIDIALLIIPVFIPMSKESRLWNQINYLMTIRVCNFKEVVGSIISYQFGDIVISYVAMLFIVYGILAIVPFFFIKRAYANHQVAK